MKSPQLSNFQILDCTIRDGGYLNNWAFDKSMVKELYRNLSRTGIDFIEIGFRNIQEKNTGIWCSTPEDLVNEISEGISGVGICLLVDLGKVDLNDIPAAKTSRVKLYRVACNKGQVDEAIGYCEEIKSRGYLVSLQLMGIVNYTREELDLAVPAIQKSSADYVYFADTYGSLFPEDIKGYIDALKPTGKKIGFHPHNNLQLAFANTLKAIRHGIDIVDGTVYGMGRGAGNLPLEVLLTYLERRLGHDRYNALPALDLIDRYFLEMNDDIRWGYNLPYMLSGSNAVHPNFATYMMNHYQYTIDDINKVLEVIKDINLVGYSKQLMDNIIKSGFVKPKETASKIEIDREALEHVRQSHDVQYVNRHEGRDFLVLANGPSLQEFKLEIDDFIRQFKPVVMGANNLGGLFIPDYHGFSNKKRFISYIQQVDRKSSLLLSSAFPKNFIADYTQREYEFLVHGNVLSADFSVEDGIITSNCGTISVLLIGAAIVMGARRIFVAGMDGYKDKANFLSNRIHFYDTREESKKEAVDFRAYLEVHNNNERLLHSINGYLHSWGREGITIITPTSHKYFYQNLKNLSAA